jgi:hypothetical protein
VGAHATFEKAAPTNRMKNKTTNAGYETTGDEYEMTLKGQLGASEKRRLVLKK